MAPIASSLVNSHSVARYILAVVFFLLIFQKLQKGTNQYFNSLEPYGIITYFTTQSLSVLNARNIPAFFELYKHILVAAVLYFSLALVVRTKKQIITITTVLIITIGVNICIQTLIYFFPESHGLLQYFFYDKNWIVVELNAMRDRYFVDIYDSALIPLILWKFAQSPKNIIFPIIAAPTILFAYISNFRTQFALMFFGLISSLALFFLQRKKLDFRKAFLFLALSTAVICLLFITVPRENTVTIERIFDPENTEYQSLFKRFDLWKQSIDMLRAYPWFGVGIRNFYDYYQSPLIGRYSLSSSVNDFNRITLANPHNIFFAASAETGFIGLLGLMCMLGIFLIHDIRNFRVKSYIEQSLIASFWVLFSFSLLNPPDTLQYLSLFFVLRILITLWRKLASSSPTEKKFI